MTRRAWITEYDDVLAAVNGIVKTEQVREWLKWVASPEVDTPFLFEGALAGFLELPSADFFRSTVGFFGFLLSPCLILLFCYSVPFCYLIFIVPGQVRYFRYAPCAKTTWEVKKDTREKKEEEKRVGDRKVSRGSSRCRVLVFITE